MPSDRSIAKLIRRTTTANGPAWLRRRAAWRLAGHAWQDGNPAAAAALVRMAASPDQEVAAISYDALGRIHDEAAIDAVCAAWGEHNEHGLAELLRRPGWQPGSHVESWVLGALRTGHLELLAAGEMRVVHALVEVADSDRSACRDQAREALLNLRRQDARDYVCEQAIENGSEAALEAAVTARYEPTDPACRAVLLFLAGDFDRYADLDFDGALLRAAHAVLSEHIRLRLARQARAAGRVEWLRIVAGSRRPDSLADGEWEAALAMLTAGAQWEDLWRLALDAPPMWSARILRELGRRQWLPESGAERSGCAYLIELAQRCSEDVPDGQFVPGSRTTSSLFDEQPGDPDDSYAQFTERESGLLVPRPAGDPPPRQVLPDATKDGLLVRSGPGHVRKWRSTLRAAARTPVARLGPAELEELRIVDGGTPDERPWIELMTALVGWRQRHDIEIDADTVAMHDDRDIEVGE